MSNQIFETMIQHWIKKIKEAGFEDPTKEIIKYNHGDKTIVLQLYTEDQWNAKINKNTAQSLASKLGFNSKADYTVSVEEVIYHVEILNK